MKRKVIRTKIVPCISSKIIQEDDECQNLKELEVKLGKEYILKKIFDEKEMSYKNLLELYEQFTQGQENSLFAWMYILTDDFGIVINEHIYLYHYDLDISNQQKSLFPWEYMDSKRYIGDTWWTNDDEILNDIKALSILDFMDKYKGY